MKNNFSQPFKDSQLLDVSIFIQVDKDEYILDEIQNAGTLSEYTPFRLQVEQNEDFRLTIAAYLFRKGLLIAKIRELVKEVSVEYSFIDDSPGQSTTEICFLVQAERTHDSNHMEGFSLKKMDNVCRSSSFIENIELIALDILAI